MVKVTLPNVLQKLHPSVLISLYTVATRGKVNWKPLVGGFVLNSVCLNCAKTN